MLVVLLLGLGLRLINLNQSLWLDEAVSAKVVTSLKLSEILTKFSPADFHPPAYYWILKLWTGVFGTSEVGLRSLSVVAGVLTIYIVYKMAGKTAGLLTAINPLLIYYSQEARQYSLVTLFLMISVYAFTKLLKGFDHVKRDKYSNPYKWLLVYNIFSALSFATFYGSAFLLFAMALYLLINKNYKLLILSNIGWLVTIFLLKDLIIFQMASSQQQLLNVKNWSLVLGKVNLKNLLLIPIKFTSGRISFYPKWLYYILAGGWAGLVIRNACMRSLQNKDKKIWFLILASLSVAMLFSLKSPMIQYFRFLYLVPLFLMLIKRKWLVGGFLAWSLLYLLTPNFHREDWKSLSSDLNKEVYLIETVSDPIKYYRPEIEINDLKGEISGEQIIVVPYATQIHGLDYQKKLTDLGYQKIGEKSYRQISLETWKSEK